MTSYQIAEGIAYDAYMGYHRARLALPEGLEMVDQLRQYLVVDRGEVYAIVYRNGFNSGMPSVHATVHKETKQVCLSLQWSQGSPWAPWKPLRRSTGSVPRS